ncbi:MAG TPA: hypothetical protein VNU70_03220 [Puia sp.]|nr:hypothetical protein [Puia sp.]
MIRTTKQRPLYKLLFRQIAFSALCLPLLSTAQSSKKFGIWKVIPCEYRCWYIRNDSTIWSYNNGSPLPVQFPIGNNKAVTAAGGFNYFRVIDNHGYLWTSLINYTTNTVRTEKDTLGRPFDGNWFVDAFAHSCLTIRSDSSIWYFGVDAFSFFYPNGNLVLMTGAVMKPTQLSPPGMKFKKALFGGYKIVALTTDGQVWEFITGNRTPVRKTTPRPATDIFVSHLDMAGCIIPDPGETSGMGYPYVWGGRNSMYGAPTPYTQPTSVKTLWKMTVPVREITTSSNTVHYIDSLDNMYGIGFNSLGEVGNGREFVNQYDYSNFPNYAWTYVDYENPSGAPPARVGAGIRWRHLWSNNFYTLYTYAQDDDDQLYSWGRNKTGVLGNGLNCMEDRFHPDGLDVLIPTKVRPLSARWQNYHFSPPTIHAGSDTTVSGSSVRLTGSATPPLLAKATPIAANGIDTVPYKIISYQWTLVKGNRNAQFGSPQSPSTAVTGLVPGTYVFNLKTTDNNTGTQSANVTVTVKPPANTTKK